MGRLANTQLCEDVDVARWAGGSDTAVSGRAGRRRCPSRMASATATILRLLRRA